MLPFLKPKAKQVGVITEFRKPDDKEVHEGLEGVRMASRDLIEAVKEGNEEGVAKALQAAFEILDSLPHHEGPHEE